LGDLSLAKHIYLQPDAPDPIHSDELVLALVRKHVPNAKSVTGVDESGGEARTYAVDSNIILKVQRPQRSRPLTSLEKEVFFLQQLSVEQQISVPKVLGYGREDTIEYTVMTRIPGVAIVSTTLEGGARKKTLFKLGQTLKRIHSVPQNPFHESGLFPGETNFAEVRAEFQHSFEELLERITERKIAWVLPYTPEQVVQKSLASLPKSEELVALHSNPGPTHAFVSGSTGLFTGLIDFGDAYFSHPAWDLRRWNLPEDRQAVLAGYTAEKEVNDAFLSTWKIVMILSDMMAIAYQTKSSVESAADLKALVEQL